MTQKRDWIYTIGQIALIAFIPLCILQNTGRINLTGILYPCIFHRLSGLYCPGCGGTRAVKALLEGHFIQCLLYHPFVFYCAVMYVLYMGSHTLARISKKISLSHGVLPKKGLTFRISYVYAGVLIVLLQWMLKNLFVLINYL